jgi:NADPH:quinone reductase-like Zn-dependent oxidoreductase
MKAYHITPRDDAPTLDRVEIDRPEVKPGEVQIRVGAVSLNYGDSLIETGTYERMARKMGRPGLGDRPFIPCSDGAGEVVAVGEGVTAFSPGDRVASTYVQGWISGRLESAWVGGSTPGRVPIPGVLAEYATLPAHGFVPIPDHLSFEEAATLPCAGLTAWNAAVTAGMKAGDTVLVHGTGGVSIFCLQFAVAAGARVIMTSSSDAKLDRARELGAWQGINYSTTPDWDRVVRDLTEGAGADVVFETSGPPTLERSVAALRCEGAIALIGNRAGGGEPNIFPLMMKQARIVGIFVGSRDMFLAMNRAVHVSQLRPIVDRVFGFEEAPAAYRYFEPGGHFGKVVISMR